MKNDEISGYGTCVGRNQKFGLEARNVAEHGGLQKFNIYVTVTIL